MNILGADLPPLHRELIKLVHFNLGLSILSVMFPYSPPKNNLIDLMKSTTNNHESFRQPHLSVVRHWTFVSTVNLGPLLSSLH